MYTYLAQAFSAGSVVGSVKVHATSSGDATEQATEKLGHLKRGKSNHIKRPTPIFVIGVRPL